MNSTALIFILGVCLIDIAICNTARTCYSCNGIECSLTSLNKTTKCVNPLDYCVTIFDKFEVVQKGCSMEVAIEKRRNCDRNTPECHKCNTDRCNNLGQKYFKCIQCDSSKNAECASNPKKLTVLQCPSPTATNSFCYIKYANGLTKRGCAGSVAEQKACFIDASCMLCSPGDITNCNTVDFQPGTRAMIL